MVDNVVEFFTGEIGWATALLITLAGVVVVFAGKILLKLTIGGAFGALLGYIVAKLVLMFNGGFAAALVLGFLAFIVGFFLGWFIFKLAIAIIVGFLIGLFIASIFNMFNDLPLLIITMLLSIGISYIMAEKIISIFTLFAGLAIFYIGLYFLTHNSLIAIIATAALFAFVVINKLKSGRK